MAQQLAPLLTLQIMGPQGHKERKYDPNNKEEVRKIKAFIKKKIDEGWTLYGMKAGEKIMDKINDFNGIDDDKLDRFILAGHEKVTKKMLATPNAGG